MHMYICVCVSTVSSGLTLTPMTVLHLSLKLKYGAMLLYLDPETEEKENLSKSILPKEAIFRALTQSPLARTGLNS